MALVITDYGMGNLRSVQKAFEQLGCPSCISSDADVIRHADRVVVPGVGAFGAAASALNRLGLDEAIRDAVHRGVPVLGICLGLQLVFASSQESPDSTPGLGLLEGEVLRFPVMTDACGRPLKIPHIGWNQVHPIGNDPLFAGVQPDSYAYFVHSYYVQPADATASIAVSEYGMRFTCAIAQGSLRAVQFHPEKSSRVGMRILHNFLSL